MKNYMVGLLVLIGYSCINHGGKVESVRPVGIDRFTMHTSRASIRALEVVDDQTVWYAGSAGEYGWTEDGGAHWTVDSIRTDSIVPNFRSLVVTGQAVFLLSIAAPALLYKSVDKGLNWEVVYREDDPAAFYNAMAFWNEREGIAMGDPIDGCLSIIITRDGGNSWQKLPCNRLPSTQEGEAAFAASNSNIALYEDHAWIVTGGKKARIFHSPDKGQTWEVFNTPIIAGGKMTGIFSADFWDENLGIIFGGDWEAPHKNYHNKAITADGGHSWQLVADGHYPGYRSCVQFLPGGTGKELMAVGNRGISWSNDGGNSWQKLSDESFYTLRFGSQSKIAWVAGDKRVAKIEWHK